MVKNDMEIKGFRGDYAWLSNMFLCPLKMPDGVTYPSRENAFQAQKTKDIGLRRRISVVSPRDAKRIGRNILLVDDWDEIRVKVMFSVLENFFHQNELYKEKLIMTEDKYIEETNSWGDRFWGVCDGIGENALGHILMELRSRFVLTK